jgi:hypothetical protein
MSAKANDMIRLLPFMINERNKLFSYKDCRFALEKEKENTARIVLFKELGITNTYTLEASFYGGEALGKIVYEEESSSENESEELQDEEVDGEDEEEEDEDEEDKEELEVRECMFEGKSVKVIPEASELDDEGKEFYSSEMEKKRRDSLGNQRV